MLLAIDIGNSKIKGAVFKDNTILVHFVFDYTDWQKKIEKIFSHYPELTHLVVASVGKLSKSDFLWLDKKVKISFVSSEMNFPFTNSYKTPHTLGIDRMVLACGAVLQFPQKNRLVIDAGTAITYDFIDEHDNYLGGAISPGIQLRYKSLNDHTAKLPLLHTPDEDFFIGQTTSESIHSGVVNGVIHEIEGFIDRYRATYENFIIILTGGDTVFLAKRLKSTIFANQNFLLESLNDLYQFQNND
jgi:type III pantothenate kinase